MIIRSPDGILLPSSNWGFVRGIRRICCCTSVCRVKKCNNSEVPPSNLVFLLDVSGSMDDANKLPLVKAMKLLVVSCGRRTG